MPKWVSITLAVSRFMSVSFIAILLLNPLLKYLERIVEKPTIFLAIDNSESLIMGSDSVYLRDVFEGDLKTFRSALEKKYDIVELGESQNVAHNFASKVTDLSSYFSEGTKLYGGRNVAGMVLLSDGIYNKGVSPSFAAQRMNIPVFTIPLGDTTIRKDIAIYTAKANAITFLGNHFPIEVVVNATKASGQNVSLSLWQGSKEIGNKGVKVQGNRFATTHTFMVEATKQGLQQYTVRVTGVQNELNRANNQKHVYTEVLDARQKILVLAHAPHPDLAALRTAIESNDQYEMTIEIGDYSPIKKASYDLIITHQLPADSKEYNLMRNIKEKQIPIFSFLGTSTNLNMFNRLELGTNGNRNNFNQGLSTVNPAFNLFQPENDLTDFLNHAPPLTTPFGDYNSPRSSDVLIYQKIGNVKTKMPLWFFNKNESYRSGVCCGEGIWRWKFHDYEQNESHLNLGNLIQKSIQYLALKDDKRRFRVYTSSRSFYENEKINFIAEVYNESYEFTPGAEVKVNLRHENGDQYEYSLLPQQTSYTYQVGSLPPGNYSFDATSQVDGRKENVSGKFIVKELQLERVNLTANHALLRQVAQETGGKMFYKNQWSDLATNLLDLPNSASIAKTNHRYRDLIQSLGLRR